MIKSMMAQMDANRTEMQKGGNLLKEEEARREAARKAKEEAVAKAAAAEKAEEVAEEGSGSATEGSGEPVAKEDDEIASLQVQLKALEDKTGIVGESPERADGGSKGPKGGKAGGRVRPAGPGSAAVCHLRQYFARDTS